MTVNGQMGWVLSVSFVAWITLSSFVTAGLTPEQQQMPADATSQLAKVETNLKLAEDAAGPGKAQPPRLDRRPRWAARATSSITGRNRR
jgi:hypothetical protein